MEPPGGAAMEAIIPLEASLIRIANSENPMRKSHSRPTLSAKVRGGGLARPPLGITRGYQKALVTPGLTVVRRLWMAIDTQTTNIAQLIQEAQLVLGWPTHGANSIIWRSRSSNEIRCPIASMDPSLTGETPHTIFTFVTLK